MPGTKAWFPSLVHLPSFRFLPRLPGAQTGHCHPNHTPLRWDRRHPPRCIKLWISMIWWSNHTTPYLELDRFREKIFVIPHNNNNLWLKHNMLLKLIQHVCVWYLVGLVQAGWLVIGLICFFYWKTQAEDLNLNRKAVNQYWHGKAYGLCKCKVFFRGGAGSSPLTIITVHHAFPRSYWNVGNK